MNQVIKQDEVEKRIVTIRNKNVILDRDVADLYGVKTKEINQAVSRNPDKFPSGYIMNLTQIEKDELVTICDHLQNLKFSPNPPIAFTESGLYMLIAIKAYYWFEGTATGALYSRRNERILFIYISKKNPLISP